MLIKIAWRNIWRSKVRTFVVITSIGLGLWAGVFASAFVQGMMKSRVNMVIEKEMSHFQFHHKDFREEQEAKMYMANTDEMVDKLNQDNDVVATTSRLIAMAMMGSANQNGSVKLVGIDMPIVRHVP